MDGDIEKSPDFIFWLEKIREALGRPEKDFPLMLSSSAWRERFSSGKSIGAAILDARKDNVVGLPVKSGLHVLLASSSEDARGNWCVVAISSSRSTCEAAAVEWSKLSKNNVCKSEFLPGHRFPVFLGEDAWGLPVFIEQSQLSMSDFSRYNCLYAVDGEWVSPGWRTQGDADYSGLRQIMSKSVALQGDMSRGLTP